MVVNLVLLGGVVAMVAVYGYRIVSNFLRFACHLYFRKITVYGINNLPREGPVVVCPNHPNMFIDALLVVTECTRMGRPPYAWAKASLFKQPLMAKILKLLGAVPVFRPPKPTGLQDVDSDKTPEELAAATRQMFKSTWDVLAKGNLVVLFPEGTSYTLPRMLNLRTGTMRVATGFVKEHDAPITVVPLGLTYYNKDHFRSEVTLEYGTPIVIDQATIQSTAFVADEHAEIKRLTELLQERMHGVTLNGNDFSSFRIARMIRRLYVGGALSPKDDVHFTQQLIDLVDGKLTTKETEQVVLDQLKADVVAYQAKLDELRLKDADLLVLVAEESLLQLVLERLCYLMVLLPLALPGVILNFPFYLIGNKLNELAGFTESKSMFKLFAGMVLVPVQWVFLIGTSWYVYGSSAAYSVAIALPLCFYSHIRVLEESRSIMENVWFLGSIATRKDRVTKLRDERTQLATTVKGVVDALVKDPIMESVKKAVSPVHQQTLRHRTKSRTDLTFMNSTS
ncbi:acyltransferase [Achlya hypogyna]|uniref:Acyltransferase n=1 Tax=Achlya hypogyna TaxID=1202772 RepID=A0A1V9ZD47_ACHHY|nr:acyltransferase [Achlya hypogyna]